MFMQRPLQFTPNILRSLYMLCRILVHNTCDGDQHTVHLIINLIILIICKLEALQSTKIYI